MDFQNPGRDPHFLSTHFLILGGGGGGVSTYTQSRLKYMSSQLKHINKTVKAYSNISKTRELIKVIYNIFD